MGNESGDYRAIRKRGQKEKTITVMKRYRILEKTYHQENEYTKYDTRSERVRSNRK